MIGHAYLKLYPYVVAGFFISSMYAPEIRQKKPNEWYRNTVKNLLLYRIPLARGGMKNRIPQGWMIPHIKIKITEITLEKELNTENLHVLLLY